MDTSNVFFTHQTKRDYKKQKESCLIDIQCSERLEIYKTNTSIECVWKEAKIISQGF